MPKLVRSITLATTMAVILLFSPALSGTAMAVALDPSTSADPAVTPTESVPAVPAAFERDASGSQVVIFSKSAPREFEFYAQVPSGGHLVSAENTKEDGKTKTDILVEDAAGKVVGAYDGAWVFDAAGQPVSSSYQIKGKKLVQTVKFNQSTTFPVVLEPIYSPVGTPFAGDTSGDSQLAEGLGMARAAAKPFVGIPSNYVYNPKLGSLHDYCSYSPDEFRNPFGANANFRGPCARHDMCYGGKKTSEFTCDNRLRSDMFTNCNYQYGTFNPTRLACRDTANVYWTAVVIGR